MAEKTITIGNLSGDDNSIPTLVTCTAYLVYFDVRIKLSAQLLVLYEERTRLGVEVALLNVTLFYCWINSDVYTSQNKPIAN